VIQVCSLAFGPFAEIEPLNRGFSPGHAKMRITVDTETSPSVPDTQVLERLREGFPGLARHQCRAQETSLSKREAGTPILLMEGDSSANQAHILEHLILEILGALDRRSTKLSGVTCAYETPRERNDVFVECGDRETGGFAALLGIEAMNAVLTGESLTPLYPDVVQSVRALRWHDSSVWPASRLAQLTGIPRDRASHALELLAHIDLVEKQQYAMNLSGEPHYRFVGNGEREEGED